MGLKPQDQARKFVSEGIEAAKAGAKIDPTKYARERAVLEKLVNVKAAGFRGIVLTGIAGKKIDPSYDPTTDFYGSSPRTIFEKGIYYALQEHRVPCGKSDPLNVAKNAQVIDKAWAQGRRPETAALAAVEYLKLIQGNWADEAYREDLIALFFARLWEYAELLRASDVPLAPFEGTAPIVLASKLTKFVIDYPEGGAVPQVVVGTLISKLRADHPAYGTVGGVHESVFGTNTTAKKPADVWEVMADGEIGALYEVTAKTIDAKRLDDCVEAMKALDLGGRVVTFICRLPQDAATLAISNGSLTYRDATFQFLDLRAFIVLTFCILPLHRQAEVIEEIDAFVKDINRKAPTKDGWAAAFG
jgi:hypothetical protein